MTNWATGEAVTYAVLTAVALYLLWHIIPALKGLIFELLSASRSKNRITLERAFEYDNIDIGVAFRRVVERLYGIQSVQGARRWLVRDEVRFFLAQTGAREGEREEGVYGRVEVKGLSGTLTVVPKGSPLITVEDVKLSKRARVDELLDAVEKELATASIYRGKPVIFGPEMRFMDLGSIREDEIVYNSEVISALGAHVWSLIERPALCSFVGAPEQHKVLLAGAPGSGKTLVGNLTARKAVERGWTFIYLPPSKDPREDYIPVVFRFAAYYQPAVVFIEDIDREQRHHDVFLFGRVLNELDGIQSKSLRILTLMTTNYPEKVGALLQRPGRIDRIISLDTFSLEDAIRLIRKNIQPRLLSEDINWEEVARSCDGFLPAFIRDGVVSGAKLMAASETREGERPVITQRHLVSAAEGLRHQHEICRRATTGFHTE